MATQALERLIAQAALQQELQRLRIVVARPGDAPGDLRHAGVPRRERPVRQQTFDSVLRNNGLTEAALPRHDARRPGRSGSCWTPCGAGAAAPEAMLRPLFEGQFEKRSADMVEFPFAAAPSRRRRPRPSCSAGTTTILTSTRRPEFRRIKAIVLSPQTLAKDIPITDEDLQAAYDQHKATT